jgi:hypothetical protein
MYVQATTPAMHDVPHLLLLSPYAEDAWIEMILSRVLPENRGQQCVVPTASGIKLLDGLEKRQGCTTSIPHDGPHRIPQLALIFIVRCALNGHD